MKIDPFYLIIDGTHWLDRLLPQGIKLVQLRMKNRPDVELRAEIRRAKNLCARHSTTLVINDHWQLAIEEGCDFIHLGQEDLADADGARLVAVLLGQRYAAQRAQRLVRVRREF